MRGLLLAAALVALGCPGSSSEESSARVLATVGDATVDVEVFMAAAGVRGGAAEFPRSGAGFEALRDRLVQELIVEEVLLEEADRRGVVVDATRLKDALAPPDEVVEEPVGIGEHDRRVTERFGAPETRESVVRRRLRIAAIEKALRAEMRAGISVTDEQVDAALARFAPRLVRPARVHCRQIFLEDAETARAIRRRLLEGEPFVALAREVHGTDGDMGWVEQKTMPPLLAGAVEGLAVGKVSDLVRSPMGYHLFEVVGHRPTSPVPDDQARAEVAGWLTDETVETRFRAWIGGRSDELAVEISEEALAALRCCRQGVPYVADPGTES